ncbi:putative quinol monooxygenase [Hymenobacter volaticus]|uniref:Antibiotic biosynthesis monooxygenase n=1 Tax=Hymenobacter volaticus TaxID=2932254 RepID=A0ABY4GFC7_9BACT|nr:putative quinol monooxygenase [Hymenobacter volaticus]UOQ69642.1 antibiotic biosynthesis monooxygenase [Hymenobacter volaticus]
MPAADKSAERHLIATLQSKPEHRAQVQELLLQLVEPVRGESGCLYYNIFQQAEDPDAVLVVAGWLNYEAAAAHPTHPSVPGVIELIMPLLTSPIPITRLPTRRLSGNPA